MYVSTALTFLVWPEAELCCQTSALESPECLVLKLELVTAAGNSQPLSQVLWVPSDKAFLLLAFSASGGVLLPSHLLPALGKK